MQNQLNIALVQANLAWENPEYNRTYFENEIRAISFFTDLVMLPEMFTSGFTMNPKKIAETMQGKTVHWLKNTAKKYAIAITGSLVIKEGSNFYNRLLFVLPNGEILYYDKKHLFTLAGEDKVYYPGTKKLIVTHKGWKICPLICYDLRFPVWSRNTKNYDLLLYVANWPKPRIQAWSKLLSARAIENVCYCAGVNRVGTDAKNNFYPGASAVYDFTGKKMLSFSNNMATTKVVSLDKTKLINFREQYPFLDNQDAFNLKA